MRWKIGKILIVLVAIFFMEGQRLNASEVTYDGAELLKEEKEELVITPYELEYDQIKEYPEYSNTIPEIRLRHKDENYITKYSLTKENQEKISGQLTKYEEEIIISGNQFEEGYNQLEVWMEDQEEKKIEAYQVQKIFIIDTQKPNVLLYEYENESEQEIMIYKEKKKVLIRTEDERSGISGIFYQLQGEEEQFVESAEAMIEIPLNYSGVITAYSIDRAGNRTDKVISKGIICESQKPSISLQGPKGFDKWYKEDISLAVQINDVGVSAGIERIHCYVNSEIVLDKHIEELYVTDWNTSILLNRPSTNNEAISVVVEVMDRAGNSSNISRLIYLDKQLPVVSITGFTQYLITAQPVEAIFTATDENEIASIVTKIQWQQVDGTITLLEGPAWSKKDNQEIGVLRIEREGRFQLEMIVTDMAGNVSTAKMQVIIDKANPIIKYVDQLHKKYIKEFQWNYRIEELVEDDTSYSYNMKLDGIYYSADEKVTREGMHTLQLHVVDAAGNQAEAKAEFIVDHTKPEIIVEHMEDGKAYENGTTIDIKVENSQDRLEEIQINGEKQKISQKNNFQYTFQNTKTYQIAIVAKDFAGNKAEKKITVEITNKKSMAKKIMEPFTNRRKAKQENQLKPGETTEKKSDNVTGFGWIWLVGIGGCGVTWFIVWHKKIP